MVTKMPWQVALFGSRAGPAWVNYSNQSLANLKGNTTSKQMLKEIANRKIEGSRILYVPAGFSSWTPSDNGKVYNLPLSVTVPLWNGTFATLGEGIGIVEANYKGSYFEAYSAQKFTVTFQPFFVDKDNVVAAAEAAWVEVTSPADYLLAHHTDVINTGKWQISSARCVAGSLWYLRFNTSKILNKIFKDYMKQVGTVRNTGKLNSEPMEGYLHILIIAGNTSAISYAHRWSLELITAQADLGVI